MGTTITPLPSGGPDDEGHLIFLGDGKSPVSRFLEAKKKPKKIFAEAEGVMNPRRSKAKKIVKPSKGKNLRASDSSIKSKKRGIFGETYKPVAAGNKGVRVAESAPKGWGSTVKRMKKHPEIENPFALAHWMSGEGYTPGGKAKK